MLGRRERDKKEVPALPISLCYAKTYNTGDVIGLGQTVDEHSRIVGMAAREIISVYPQGLRKKLFPNGSDLVASIHDVGKINPLFQEKLRRADPSYQNNSLPELKSARPEQENSVGYHSDVSKLTLLDQHRRVAEIAGMHHGSLSRISVDSDHETLGGKGWQSARMELVTQLKQFFGREWPEINDDLHTLVLAGLTTVSDWVGSSIQKDISRMNESQIQNLVRGAVQKAGFVRPRYQFGLSFEELYPGFIPRPIQENMIQMADRPGVYILEAPMGEGKTEAALTAAYKILESGEGTGIYFALPTQLTSNKIYERFNRFLDSILDEEDKHRAQLLHSSSWMMQTSLGEDGRPGYSWFDNRKRALLAPFAVGTIDQALMAVMNVRHGFVRTFALAGKVVILDEVHTYDSYTGAIMDNLIQGLRTLGCTVILLSATLDDKRKGEMLGVGSEQGFPEDYPLVTKGTKELQFSEKSEHEERLYQVHWSENREDLMETVRERAYQGEYVLWIENTVDEAQGVYKKLAAWGRENGIETGLLHSRFTGEERSLREDSWVCQYGKEGIGQRPRAGKILVGTQVLEQSLDIDADFLVTSLAPTDMILQRMGRTWRHRAADDNRPKGAEPQVIIIAPSQEEIEKKPQYCFGPSGAVYSPYVLARTYEVWSQRQTVSLPGDMRELIGRTYQERYEEGRLAAAKGEMKEQGEKLRRLAKIGLSNVMATQNDDTSPTRYSEVPTVDLLLLRKEYDRETGTIFLLNGEEIVLDKSSLTKRKEAARILMGQLISVAINKAPKPLGKNELSWIKPFLHVDYEAEARIRIGIVEPSGRITIPGGRNPNEGYRLSYSSVLGYVAKKIKENQ